MKGMRELTDCEYDRIEAYFKQHGKLRDRAMFAVQRFAGYRISEVLSLRVKDLFNPDLSMVRAVYVNPANMKGQSGRIQIPVHSRLREALLDHITVFKQKEGFSFDWYLFKSRKGQNKPISDVQAWRILKEATDQLGIYDSVATHSMRKTFANRIYHNTGKDIVATQTIMGHKSPKTTLHYINVNQKLIESAVLSQ